MGGSGSCQKFLFGLVQSGCGTDTSTKIQPEIDQKAITRVLLENTVFLRTLVSNIQSVKVNISNVKCKNLDINLKQYINSESKVVQNVKVEQVSTITSELKAVVDTDLARIIKLKGDIFSGDPVLNSSTYVAGKYYQLIDNNINEKSVTDIVNAVFNKQTETINIMNVEGINCNITTDQNMLVSYAATQIATVLQNALVTNREIDEINTRIKDKIDIEVAGPFTVLSDFINLLKSLGYYLLIGAIILVVALLIGGVIFLFLTSGVLQSPGGQQALVVGAQAAGASAKFA